MLKELINSKKTTNKNYYSKMCTISDVKNQKVEDKSYTDMVTLYLNFNKVNGDKSKKRLTFWITIKDNQIEKKIVTFADGRNKEMFNDSGFIDFLACLRGGSVEIKDDTLVELETINGETLPILFYKSTKSEYFEVFRRFKPSKAELEKSFTTYPPKDAVKIDNETNDTEPEPDADNCPW